MKICLKMLEMSILETQIPRPTPPFQKARGFGAHCAPLLKVLDPSLLRTLRLDRRREYPAI